MNTALRYAEAEVKKLKRSEGKSGFVTFDFVLAFDRSEDDMKKLVGYSAFEEALAELGGEHTEDVIHKACDMSHFNRRSVIFNDMPRKKPNDKHIPVTSTKQQARAFLCRQEQMRYRLFDLN